MQDLKGCPQHPVRHAEGDVWAHVHMVCESMAALPAWRELLENERQILFTSALLHDVAKPICTRIEPDGSISSRGHSWRGAVRARHILWRRGVPFGEREQIAAIVRHHLVPFFMADSENPRRLAIEVSQTVRCDWLAIMAESDARGRICPDPEQILGQIQLFRERSADFGCLSAPYPFASDQARFQFFRDPNRSPDSPAEEGYSCEAILMCGLPGAGKDFWVRKNMPGAEIVSLDALRIEMGVAPSDPQGTVLNRAREIATEHMLAKQVVHLERVEPKQARPRRMRTPVQRV